MPSGTKYKLPIEWRVLTGEGHGWSPAVCPFEG